MTDTRHRKVEEAFHDLVELPEAERAERLSVETTTFRRAVTRLVDAHNRLTDRFLPDVEPTAPAPVEPDRSGATIGDCRLLRSIGEGGMGSVYLARQLSPPRDVAIKVVRAGRMTERAMRRFELEIEVLGTLQHPSIARIYAAGTTTQPDLSGAPTAVPYFVMEYVRGRPILEFVRRQALGLHQRLELFCGVCDAIQYAHQRGVLHRDIKSENVLVTEEETTGAIGAASSGPHGRPKVLDFGIARPLSDTFGKDGESWGETAAGDVIGSLSCMSPEQVDGSMDVDARSDVYALGALLYALCAGRPALSFDDSSLPEAIQTIRHGRVTPLGDVDASLKGDVETIAAKALAKDPSERYRSAYDLARDVRLHLAGEPIEARAHSRLYVLRRELKRHRSLAIGVLAAFALVTAFGVHSSRQAEENRELAQAESEARLAAEYALARSDIDRGRLLGRVDNPHSEAVLWRALFSDPQSLAARWALREYYFEHVALASKPPSGSSFTGLDFLGNSARILVSSVDGSVELLASDDLRTLGAVSLEIGLEPSLESGPDVDLTAQCLAVDDSLAALGTSDGRVLLLDLELMAVVGSLEGHAKRVNALAFNGSALLSISADGSLCEWSVASRTLVQRRDLAIGALYSMAIGPRGRIAVGGAKRILLFESVLGSETEVLAGLDNRATGLGFAEDGDVLWSTSQGRDLVRWDLVSGSRESGRQSDGTLRSLALDSSGSTLVTAGRVRARVTDTKTWTSRATFSIGRSHKSMVLSADGQRLLIAEEEGSLRLWNLSESAPFHRNDERAVPTSIGLSPDGSKVLRGDGGGLTRLVDRLTGTEIRRWSTDGDRVRVRYAPSGQLFGWSERLPPRLFVADATRNEVVLVVDDVARNNTHAFAFHPTEPLVAVASTKGDVEVWAPGSDAPLRRIGNSSSSSRAVAFAAGGEELLVLDTDADAIQSYGFAQGDERARFESDSDLWTIDVSPSGRYLAAAATDGIVHAWDLATGVQLPDSIGHPGPVRGVHFLRGEESIVASVANDDILRLWDVREGRNIGDIRIPQTTRPVSVDSTPDGRLFALGSDSNRSFVVDVALVNRCVARNLEFALSQFGGSELSEETVGAVRAWGVELLERARSGESSN